MTRRWFVLGMALVAIGLGLRFAWPSGSSELEGLLMEPPTGEASQAAFPEGLGATSQVVGSQSSGTLRAQVPQEFGTSSVDSRRLSGRVLTGAQAWPVPGAWVRLMVADKQLAAGGCDELGGFELRGVFLDGELEDERAHWSVVSETHSVEAILPFDPDTKYSKLLVEAELLITGFIKTPFVDRQPYPAVFLQAPVGGTNSARFGSTAARKGGAFELRLPVAAWRDSMQFAVDDRYSAPFRRPLRPTGLVMDLGVLTLDPGFTLRGVVDSDLPAPYRSQQVSAYLDEHGTELQESSFAGSRMIDGKLCRESRTVSLNPDGSFEMRGLARRRYKLLVRPPGVFTQSHALVQKQSMVTVDLRDLHERSEPQRMSDWWGVAIIQLRIPPGNSLPAWATVHGMVRTTEILLARTPIDPLEGTFWMPIPPGEPWSGQMRFEQGYEDQELDVAAMEAQAIREYAIQLQPKNEEGHSLVIELSDPEGDAVARISGQKIAVRMTAFTLDDEGAWRPHRGLMLEPEGTHWVVRNLTRGEYRFRLQGSGYDDPDLMLAPIEVDVQVGSAPLKPLQLQFHLGGKVRIRLTDEKGAPLAEHFAEVLELNGQPPLEVYRNSQPDGDPEKGNFYRRHCNAAGWVEGLAPLPPGRYLVRAFAFHGESNSEEQEIEIKPGEVTRAKLICTKPGDE